MVVRTAVFWGITQQIAVISYQRFGDNLSVPFAAFKNTKFLDPEDGTNSLSQNVGKKLSLLTA